jgi:hypothetical protein
MPFLHMLFTVFPHLTSFHPLSLLWSLFLPKAKAPPTPTMDLHSKIVCKGSIQRLQMRILGLSFEQWASALASCSLVYLFKGFIWLLLEFWLCLELKKEWLGFFFVCFFFYIVGYTTQSRHLVLTPDARVSRWSKAIYHLHDKPTDKWSLLLSSGHAVQPQSLHRVSPPAHRPRPKWLCGLRWPPLFHCADCSP